MNFYHVGHEMGMGNMRFLNTGPSTYAELFNPSRSRSSILTDAREGRFAYIDLPNIPVDQTGLWFHAYIALDNRTRYLWDEVPPLGLTSSSGSIICELRYSENGPFRLRLLGTASTEVMLLSPLLDIGHFTIDLHLFYSSITEALSVEIYVNGILDVATQAASPSLSLASIGLSNTNSHYISNIFWGWSELIVADVDTRGMQVISSWPTGAGQYTESTGSYANVSEVSPDGNVAEFTAAGQRLTMTHRGIGTPRGQILAVAVGGQASADATTQLVEMWRNGTGVEFTGTTPLTTNPVLAGFFSIHPVNPVTGKLWTYSDLNAMQIGVRSALAPIPEEN